jgi:hypothetical protein
VRQKEAAGLRLDDQLDHRPGSGVDGVLQPSEPQASKIEIQGARYLGTSQRMVDPVMKGDST